MRDMAFSYILRGCWISTRYTNITNIIPIGEDSFDEYSVSEDSLALLVLVVLELVGTRDRYEICPFLHTLKEPIIQL